MRWPAALRTPSGRVDWEYLFGLFLALAVAGLVAPVLMGCASVEEPHPYFINGGDYREVSRGS